MLDRNGVLIDLHKSLLNLRYAEEALAARYKEQEMRTPAHFGTGQEAVAAGVCGALRQSDIVVSHHRCHNHFLAKGGSVFALAAELYGRSSGCSGGRGGSVHLTDRVHGVLGTSAILGEMSAIATGVALSFQMDRRDDVAVTFFGDGSMEEGAIYECFNYAAIKALPVLYICENNLYATESPASVRQPKGTRLGARAESFGIPAVTVDGNDVLAVFEAAAEAVAHARAGKGPSFIECMTYRWREHVGPNFDHDLGRTYRSRDEVESWMDRCPVRHSRDRLLSQGLISEKDLDNLDRQVRDEVVKAIDAARAADWPLVETLFENI